MLSGDGPMNLDGKRLQTLLLSQSLGALEHAYTSSAPVCGITTLLHVNSPDLGLYIFHTYNNLSVQWGY